LSTLQSNCCLQGEADERMRICLVTLATPNILPYARYGLTNKRAYARMHGYCFHAYGEVADTTRAPAWSKIQLILRHLEDFDWVFWTDADSLLMNHGVRLESFLQVPSEIDMVLTTGPRDAFNTGQWFVRSSQFSRMLLAAIWENAGGWWYEKNPWEQQALIDLVARNPAWRDRMHVVPVRSMNSRPSPQYVEVAPDLEGIEYQEGDFAVHFYHTKSFELRVRGMRSYYESWLAGARMPDAATVAE